MSRGGGTLNLHASAVAIDGRGLLIVGKPGSGKSGLALRLMAHGARLVADDRVEITRRGAALVASGPASLRGLIEMRGVGLLRVDPLDHVDLAVAVDLDTAPAARMPHLREIAYLGVEIELISGLGVPNLDAGLVQLLKFGRAP